jgi:hypothetical protein
MWDSHFINGFVKNPRPLVKEELMTTDKGNAEKNKLGRVVSFSNHIF